MKNIFKTERLTLRELSIDDTTFIIQLLNSPTFLEFIGDRKVRNEEDAKKYLNDGPLKSYSDFGFGLWLVSLKANETPIGICGILKRVELDHPDIGYAFLPEFTKKGYAFEAAKATLLYAKNAFAIDTVLAITVEKNKSSIQLLNKIGLQFEKLITIKNRGEELMLFSNQVK
jgi:RimJ/RimL family protein N-acetyltransferase